MSLGFSFFVQNNFRAIFVSWYQSTIVLKMTGSTQLNYGQKTKITRNYILVFYLTFFLDKECNFVVMCKEKYYKEEEKINLFKKKDEMLMAV